MTNPFDIIAARLDSIEEAIRTTPGLQAATPPEIIDTPELCRRLDISEPTAIRWRKKKKIPFFSIGASIRYNWVTVVQQLEKSTGK